MTMSPIPVLLRPLTGPVFLGGSLKRSLATLEKLLRKKMWEAQRWGPKHRGMWMKASWPFGVFFMTGLDQERGKKYISVRWSNQKGFEIFWSDSKKALKTFLENQLQVWIVTDRG